MDIKDLWEYYSIDTMNNQTYSHHPIDIADPISYMNLLEISNYLNDNDKK